MPRSRTTEFHSLQLVEVNLNLWLVYLNELIQFSRLHLKCFTGNLSLTSKKWRNSLTALALLCGSTMFSLAQGHN